MSRSRGWCGTIHCGHLEPDTEWVSADLQQDTLLNWRKAFKPSADTQYVILGFEKGSETDRCHIQWFAYFSARKRRQSVFASLGVVCHAEPIKGTCQQNIVYCSKDNDVVTHGDESKLPNANRSGGNSKGSRNSASAARQQAVDAYKRRRMVSDVLSAEVNPSYQNVKLCELYAKFERPRSVSSDTVHIYWLFGPTGTGKSYLSEQLTSGAAFRPLSYKWWEGYDAHRAIILDDYRKDFCKFHELLRLFDIYPFRVETKGGSRQCYVNTIFVTSPQRPEELWAGRTSEDIGQLSRRVHNVIELLPTPVPGSSSICDKHVFVHKGTLPNKEVIQARLEESV